MTLEQRLAGWTGPSSDTEQAKQERTERMVREAVSSHTALSECGLTVYTKGSYPNNTNVRSDSDVDVGVQCTELFYFDGNHSSTSIYRGSWNPSTLRSELVKALQVKFPGQVDTSGSTAIRVHSSTARVDADVVPCFNYRYYFQDGSYHEGAKTFKKDNSSSLINYPAQHLANGRVKNARTNSNYKKAVRILKRVENLMYTSNYHRVVPSFFIECLAYNCPDTVFMKSTWTDVVKEMLAHVWAELQGDTEPASGRWLEVNEAKYLFFSAQAWSRKDGREFAKAAWNYLELS